MPRRFWLLKSEPEVFSIDDLARAKARGTFWDGVRNYQARNLLRDEIAVGDGVLFYHSNAAPPGVAGTAKVIRAGHPDPTQFDAKHDHYDAGSPPGAPRWFGVDIAFHSAFAKILSLDELRAVPGLGDMVLFKRSRLSVQPVTADQWAIITRLGAP